MDYKKMAATGIFYHKVSLSEGQNPIARGFIRFSSLFSPGDQHLKGPQYSWSLVCNITALCFTFLTILYDDVIALAPRLYDYKTRPPALKLSTFLPFHLDLLS